MSKTTYRRPGEPAKKKCSRCGELLPIELFYIHRREVADGVKEYRTTICCKCIYERKREKIVSKKNNRRCKDDCEFYPCFQGIDSLSSNLALTCIKFKRKNG